MIKLRAKFKIVELYKILLNGRKGKTTGWLANMYIMQSSLITWNIYGIFYAQ